MLLFFHVGIAIVSLIHSSYTFFVPSKVQLTISYVLIALTGVSGVFLTVQTPAHLAQSCFSGILYLGGVFALLFSARKKLALTAE